MKCTTTFKVHHQKGSLTNRSDALAKLHVQSNLGPTTNTLHSLAAHEHVVRALSWQFTLCTWNAEANVSLVNTSTRNWSFRARLAMNLTNPNSLCSPWNSWMIIFLMCDLTHLIGSTSCQNLVWSLPVASRSLEDCKIVSGEISQRLTVAENLFFWNWEGGWWMWLANDNWMSEWNVTTMCSISTLGKHLRKLVTILTSLESP